MTPLAAHILKQRTLPLKRRERVDDPEGIIPKIEDFHCFDVTEIQPLVRDLVSQWDDQDDLGVADCSEYIFLPAPRTWIERNEGGGIRTASYLADDGEGWITQYAVTPMGNDGRDGFAIRTVARLETKSTLLFREDGQKYEGPSGLRATLALINTPRIIGRVQHMPNRGLERRLTQHFGVGNFPLHAWTEIKLNVAKPIEIDDGEPHEAHLTGKRALHFCRAHLRLRNGRIEYVTSHWRGDPAIGIKRSRYTVAP